MADEGGGKPNARPSRPDLHFDPRDVSVRNVSGSTAGSGSGDFHVYRQERLRELTRVKKLEEEAAARTERDANLAAANARTQKETSRSQARAAKRKRKRTRSAAAAVARKQPKQGEPEAAVADRLAAGGGCGAEQAAVAAPSSGNELDPTDAGRDGPSTNARA